MITQIENSYLEKYLLHEIDRNALISLLGKEYPAGTWVSEGKAASQGVGYPGQDYQAVILNTPDAWIIRTDKAFK